jgi:HTH-type transcriptional regulator / antitoxin HigA
MDIRPIRSAEDYAHGLREIEALMSAQPGSPEGDRLEVLVALIEAWERKHHALPLPDPLAAIRFEMERRGLTVHDLEPLIGRANRVYEVLAGKRPLTLRMIRRLHEGLGIPAECLIQPSGRATAA